MRTKLLLAAGLTAAGMLAGCSGGAYYVSAPPPPRYGYVGVAPGPGFIWTEGFYDLRGSNWVWVTGRWQRPPARGRVWVAPEWRREGGGHYRYHRGYWR